MEGSLIAPMCLGTRKTMVAIPTVLGPFDVDHQQINSLDLNNMASGTSCRSIDVLPTLEIVVYLNDNILSHRYYDRCHRRYNY